MSTVNNPNNSPDNSETQSEQSSQHFSSNSFGEILPNPNLLPVTDVGSFDTIEQFETLSYDPISFVEPSEFVDPVESPIEIQQEFQPDQLAGIIATAGDDITEDVATVQTGIANAIHSGLNLIQSQVQSVVGPVTGQITTLGNEVSGAIEGIKAELDNKVDKGLEDVKLTIYPVLNAIEKQGGLEQLPYMTKLKAEDLLTTKTTQQIVEPFIPYAGPQLSNLAYWDCASQTIEPTVLEKARRDGASAVPYLAPWLQGFIEDYREPYLGDHVNTSDNLSCYIAANIVVGNLGENEVRAITYGKYGLYDVKLALNNIGDWNHPCYDSCGDDTSLPDKPEEDCTGATKVEICNLKETLQAIQDITDKPKPESEAESKLVAWWNCEIRETKLLKPGEKPEGEDWRKAGSLQETVDKFLACICDHQRQLEEKEGDKVDLIGDLLNADGFDFEGCKLPSFVTFDPKMIQELIVALKSGALAGAALNLLPQFEAFGTSASISKPGWAMLFLLMLLATGLEVAVKTWNNDDCYKGLGYIAIFNRMYYTFWERMLPGAYIEQLVAANQAVNLYCPKAIPNQQEANSAYYGNEISYNEWRCWTRANGNEDGRMTKVLQARRNKLNASESLRALKMKLITPEDYYRRLRELGYLDTSDADYIDAINRQIPGPSDLVRFMVRDTEDQQIVQQFNLTDKFDRKYTGDIAKWTEWQNIPREVMEKSWIAHWRYPGYRQLTEALHRFRNRPVGDPVRTTLDDVKIALEADDIPAFWVDRMIEMSFNPLTRVDARRAYKIGSITLQEVEQTYRDLGYNDDAVKALTKFVKDERTNSYRKHPAVKLYASGDITETDFITWLQADNADLDDQQAASEQGNLLSRQKKTAECTKAARKRYLLGEINNLELLNLLTGIGHTSTRANQLVEEWSCTKAARGKQASLTQLCTWFEEGTIDVNEYGRRLINLGWSTEDAVKIVKTCADRIAVKIKRAELAEIRRQEEEQRKLEKQAEKAARKLQMEQNKAIQAKDKAARARLARAKLLSQASDRLAKRTGVDLADIFAELKTLYNSLSKNGFGTQEVIANAINTASKDTSVETLERLQSDVIQLLTPVESYAN